MNVVELKAGDRFEEFWKEFPYEIRKGKAVARQKWEAITGEGLDTKTLDRDSNSYVPLFLKATPEEILTGLRAWMKSLKINPDFSYHDDIKYEKRPAQWLNAGRWMDYE